MLSSLRARASELYHAATDERFRQFNAQRRITDLAAREIAADAFAALQPRSPDDAVRYDPADLSRLSEDGYLPLPGLVGAGQAAEIRAHLAALRARDPYRPRLGRFRAPGEVPPEVHVAHYDHADIVRTPHVLAIANDPRVLGPVEAWLKAKPTLAAIRLWWSMPTPAGEPEHAELFHRDVDDLRFVKLFVYLTDVTDETGPHVYVPGSHRENRLTAIRRYSDEEVEAAFGGSSVRRFTGAAGTAFLETTYGLHRGLPPRSGPRLILQPLYALRPLIYGPKRPLLDRAEAPAGLDRHVNRVFVRF